MAEERPIPGRIVDRGLRDHLWLLRCKLRGEPITEPACRRCGYFVAGLTEPKCPECGADLERSGIIDPARVRPWRLRVIGIVVWTILVAVIAAPLSDCLLPTSVVHSAAMNLQRRSTGRPAADVLVRTDPSLQWPGSTISPPIALIRVKIGPNLEGDSFFLSGEIDPKSGRYRLWRMERKSSGAYMSIGGGEPGEFEGSTTILDWMHRGGFRASDPVMIEEAEEILTVVKAAFNNDCATFASTALQMPLKRFTIWGGSATPREFRTDLLCATAWGFWLVIWLTGMVLIGFLPGPSVRRETRASAGRL